jgi:pimeloyl-ACP methyl ester carboxylesterase
MDTRVNHYIDGMYGGLPPPEPHLSVMLVHELKRGLDVLHVWRVQAVETQLSWLVQVNWPTQRTGDGASLLLSPDACWPHCVNTDAARVVHERGMAWASFNRLDVAHDPPGGERSGPLFERWPRLGFGALSAWAWAIGQTVLALQQAYPHTPVGVIGHSRSGKAALLAAAMYPTVSAVISQNSGTAGASSLQHMSAGAESLAELTRAFPHWLGSLAHLPDTQSSLQADDGIALLQKIAPRGLMIIQAQDDAWANPQGARHRYQQLQDTWAQQSHALVLLERAGGHVIGEADWVAAADFLRRLGSGSATIAP